MSQQYYEIPSNFSPVWNIALALLKGRGHDETCDLLSSAKISVVNTDFDNLNGGTYGYTVYISLSVKQYTSITPEQMEKLEKSISDALNESIKGSHNDYFYVQITPLLSKEDIDWNAIGGLTGKEQLKQNIGTMMNIMVSVATGGNRIQNEDERYKKLQVQTVRDCKNLNLTYNNAFSSLWDWYGKWSTSFPTYQERRVFIRELFAPTLAYFEENENINDIETFVQLDDWERIKRTIIKIKRESNNAKDEEDFQTVGLLCREVIISLAQAVYIPWLHGENDENGKKIGNNDAVKMIGNYINMALSGSSNEELRAYAKNTNKLANRLTHERNATKKDMLLTVASTITLINFIGIIEGKY
ncbi:MAG: hypothetical protein IKN98_09455 [Bacteroidales bacterium]|nr:hypothetical protein [Bacteroidales bacterium]